MDNKTLYEIFRACRLCGAGGGYKMPIIQSVVGIESDYLELRQKIRECVQIEVSNEDKMPPLICELCVDKVNDFYEFLEMCRETNKRTRLKLGLPPQAMPTGVPDAEDCILGVTEPLLVERQHTKNRKDKLEKSKKDKEKISDHNKRKGFKRELQMLKLQDTSLSPKSFKRVKTESPSPVSNRETRRTMDTGKEWPSNRTVDTPKSILKNKIKKEEDSDDSDVSLISRVKRTRDQVLARTETPNKRVKITIKLPSPPSAKPSKYKPGPKSKSEPSPSPGVACEVCGLTFKAMQGLVSHARTAHIATFTPAKQACDPCREWFPTPEQAMAHHKQHRSGKPYRCRKCGDSFKAEAGYTEHFTKSKCVPWEEFTLPSERFTCGLCRQTFKTKALMKLHTCSGNIIKCECKCGRVYKSNKTLRRHQKTCEIKSPGDNIRVPRKYRNLKPVQVRLSRCDSLLRKGRRAYNVASLPLNFGLDKRCVYPYLSAYHPVRVKTETLERDRMVSIKQEIKDQFYREEDYVHWDSDLSSSDEEDLVEDKWRKVASLTTLSLKTLFSKRCLGKVPRKIRKIKKEKTFESLFSFDFDADLSSNINSIIENLGDVNSEKCESPVIISESLINTSAGSEKGSENNESNSVLEGGDKVIINDSSGNDSQIMSDVSLQSEKGSVSLNNDDFINNYSVINDLGLNNDQKSVNGNCYSDSRFDEIINKKSLSVNGDTINDNNELEMDKRLMAEIDAEIGESESVNSGNNVLEKDAKDKLGLEDITMGYGV